MLKKSIILSFVLLTIISFICVGCSVNGDLSGTLIEPTTSSTEEQSYIQDIKLVGAYWNKYSKDAAGRLNKYYSTTENGYSYRKVENIDLNTGCGSNTDYIYLYETRTYDKSKAITNIIGVSSDSESYQTNITDKYGIGYTVVGGIRVNGWDSSTSKYTLFDLNMNGGGKYIYLYVTYDSRIYDPITSLDIAKGEFDYQNDYEYVQNRNTELLQNLNEGNGDHLYLGISRKITGWVPYTLHVMDYDLEGNAIVKDYIVRGDTKKFTEEHLEPIIDKGEYSHFNGYTYNRQYKINVGDEIVCDGYTIVSDWTFDITIDMSAFGRENIVKENVIKTGVLERPEIDGYYVTGWHFDGESNIGPYEWLNHGGTLYPSLERRFIQDFEDFKSGYELCVAFTYDYQLETIYSLLVRNGEDYVTLGAKCVLNLRGTDYVNGLYKDLEETPTTVSSDIDYSSLTVEEQSLVEMHKLYLMMAPTDGIKNCQDYYQNEGRTESIFSEVILDLCAKEIARREK